MAKLSRARLGETSRQEEKLRQRTVKCSLEIWFGNSNGAGSSHSLRVQSYDLVDTTPRAVRGDAATFWRRAWVTGSPE